MKKVLILNGQYLPGYKGGGPIQSSANMVDNLSDQFEFKVLCADRDFKETMPYEGIVANSWNQVGAAQVFYMSPDMQTLSGFRKILNETDYDVLYLNGFFSPIFTIKPLILRRLGKLKKTKIVLAARGDFTGGATQNDLKKYGTGGLEHKKLKKYLYIAVVKLFGIYRNLLWHATSEIEVRDIQKVYPKARIFMVPNLPTRFIEKRSVIKKMPGKLRIIFISRIVPKKNLRYALEVLKQIDNGEIIFDIYGPTEDKDYWDECKKLIEEMPRNVTASYCGEISHNEVPHVFEQYHAFFFPTHGENYGHIIAEAMMNNCLCILSKGVTPWDDYIEGLDIGAPLDKQERFIEIIERLVLADQSAIDNMLKYNNDYIAQRANPAKDIELYKELFNQ